MRYLIFHSRTGAAALAAALTHVGERREEVFINHFRQLPAPKEWLFRCHKGDWTVLAVASGRQPWVLRQAIHSLTAEFRPEFQVEMLFQEEPPRLWTWLWLLRRSSALGALQCRLGQRMWRLFSRRGGDVS